MRYVGLLAVAVSLTAIAPAAQGVCTSLDAGRFPVGQVLSEAERTQLRQEAVDGTVHCSRDGAACSAQARDGVIYSWRADGRIASKKRQFADPTDLPGWQGAVDDGFATRLGAATCTRFTVSVDELEGTPALRSAPVTSAQGQSVVANVFGAGTPDDPLTVELSLGE